MAAIGLIRHDSLFSDEPQFIKSPSVPPQSHGPNFFDLPAEIRTHIYKLIFDLPTCQSAAFTSMPTLALDPTYRASTYLLPLLTNRQFHSDAHLLAFSRTLFVVTNPYIGLDMGAHMLSRLNPAQLQSLRHVAFVADARHFRKLGRGWDSCAFGVPQLDLAELTIVLRPTSYWHYLFDFNAALVMMLRDLRGARRITFVRNNALIKGTMLTWYNRLVKLILKTDLTARFEKCPPEPETRWWGWEHCGTDQKVSLLLKEAKCPDMQWDEYEGIIKPLIDELLLSMEGEEYDPDPMSRVSA